METIIGQRAGAAAAPGDLVKDGTTATFMADVVEASRHVPVIVDFWAPWCGPCRTLGPVIEKVVQQAAGRVRLVKINVDESPEIAQQMRVQSIPAVFAFQNGQPVDGFMGALPESQVRQFVDRLAGGDVPNPEEELAAAGEEALAAGDGEAAYQAYGQLLQYNPENPTAFGGLIRAMVLLGELDQAEQALAQVPVAISTHADIAGARSALELARQKADPTAIDDLRRLALVVEADPENLQARFDHANALLVVDRREEAANELLAIFRMDRTWNEEAARKKLVQLFEAWGNKDPLTIAARKKLSALLFS